MTTPLPPNAGGTDFTSGFEPTPTYEELQQTAFIQVNKERLGLVPNTDNILLTDLAPQNRQKDPAGYPTNPSRPLLDHPLDTIFGPENLKTPPDTSWNTQYALLFSHLPLDMQEILTNEKSLSFNDRSPVFTLFNHLLENGAKVLSHIDLAAAPPAEGSSLETGEKLRLQFGHELLQTSLTIVDQLNGFTMGYLKEVGANNPNFDAINGLVNLLQEQSTVLQSAIGLKDTGTINNIAATLHGMSAEFSHHITGDQMQILTNFSSTLALIAEANTLPNPLQHIALNAASTGLFDPSTLNTLNNLTQSLFPDLSKAQQNNIMHQSNFMFMASGGFMTQLADPLQGLAGRLPIESSYYTLSSVFMLLSSLSVGSMGDLLTAAHVPIVAAGHEWIPLISLLGLGLVPYLFADGAEEADLKDLYLLNATAALNMISHSGIIPSYYKQVLISSGATDKTIMQALPILTEITYFLMILSASRQHGQDSAVLIDYVRENRERIGKALQAAESLTQKASPEIAIALRQLQAYLSTENDEEFVAIAIKLLSGGEKEAWLKEFDLLRQLTTEVTKSAIAGSKEERISNVINVV